MFLCSHTLIFSYSYSYSYPYYLSRLTYFTLHSFYILFFQVYCFFFFSSSSFLSSLLLISFLLLHTAHQLSPPPPPPYINTQLLLLSPSSYYFSSRFPPFFLALFCFSFFLSFLLHSFVPLAYLPSSHWMSSMSLRDLQQVVPQPEEAAIPDVPPPRKYPAYMRKLVALFSSVQKYSAYTFLAFFGLHITSTVVVPGLGVSATKCNDIFEMCRSVYFGPGMESVFVYGAAGLHVASGLAVRLLRQFSRHKTQKRPPKKDLVIRDPSRDDIGLGGLATLWGLGYKRSWISTHFPTFTPLTFSGWVMAAAATYHWAKMRWAPLLVDGDSALVTLLYVGHYLHRSPYGRWGRGLNTAMLALLVWVSFYHSVSGLFKYRRQVSARAKKIAYGVIGVMTGLGAIAVGRMSLWPLEGGFVGRQYGRYLGLADWSWSWRLKLRLKEPSASAFGMRRGRRGQTYRQKPMLRQKTKTEWLTYCVSVWSWITESLNHWITETEAEDRKIWDWRKLEGNWRWDTEGWTDSKRWKSMFNIVVECQCYMPILDAQRQLGAQGRKNQAFEMKQCLENESASLSSNRKMLLLQQADWKLPILSSSMGS